MKQELDIRGLRSQVQAGDRLQELRRHADSLSDELSRRPRRPGQSRTCRSRCPPPDGPVEHVVVQCAAGHHSRMPADWPMRQAISPR